MSTRLRIALASMVALIAAVGAWSLWQRRGLNGAHEMVACLPQGATLAFVDVEGIRRSGLLDTIAGARSVEDTDYKSFVAGTGFDYRRDLRQAAAAFRSGDAFFVISGTFDWKKISGYAVAQGGVCRGEFCRVRSSQPGRWISFYPLRPGALALAVSANDSAALDIGVRALTPMDVPAAPVWARVPAAALAGARLPTGAQSFASPLASATDILFSIAPSGSAIAIDVDVTCASEAAASELLVKLEGATNTLRKMIEREHQQPSPRDLSGLLTAGTFRRDAIRVHGSWPLRKELVEAIASGAVN